MNTTTNHRLRPLSELAYIISESWKAPSQLAVAHIEAMSAMTSARSVLWGVTGATAIDAFLQTSRTWNGDTAREIKSELRAHLAAHNAR
jgi:hypothetical protein